MEPMRSCFVAVLTAVSGLVPNGPGLNAQQPYAGGPPQTCTTCVCEPKPTTRKVYACKAEEYCLPGCDLLSFLRAPWCGDQGPCGELRVRHRLVVKKVPDCDTKQCVPRAVPAECPVPAARENTTGRAILK
jgi:hypothetical protein